MVMYNPPHPGEAIKDVLIDGANLSVTDAAKILGISRLSMSKLIHGHSGISPEMAVRLSIALNTSSEMWLDLQKNYDLWKVERRRKELFKSVSTVKGFTRKSHRITRKAS